MLTERQTGNEDRGYRTKKKEYSGLRWEIEGVVCVCGGGGGGH